jgi:hypothetical protein
MDASTERQDDLRRGVEKMKQYIEASTTRRGLARNGWTPASMLLDGEGTYQYATTDLDPLLTQFIAQEFELLHWASECRLELQKIQDDLATLLRQMRQTAMARYVNLRSHLVNHSPDDRARWSGGHRAALVAMFHVTLGWWSLEHATQYAQKSRQLPLLWPLREFDYVEKVEEFHLISSDQPLGTYGLDLWRSTLNTVVNQCIPRYGWHTSLSELWHGLWSWYTNTIVFANHPRRRADEEDAAHRRRLANSPAHAQQEALQTLLASKLAAILDVSSLTRTSASHSSGDGMTRVKRPPRSSVLDAPDTVEDAREDAGMINEDGNLRLPIVYGECRLRLMFALEMESVFFSHTCALERLEEYEKYVATSSASRCFQDDILGHILSTKVLGHAATAWIEFLDALPERMTATSDTAIRNGIMANLGKAYLTMGEIERHYIIRLELEREDAIRRSQGRQHTMSSLTSKLNPERLIAERRQTDYFPLQQIRADATHILGHVKQNVLHPLSFSDHTRLNEQRKGEEEEEEEEPLPLAHTHEPLAIITMTETLCARLSQHQWPLTMLIQATCWLQEYAQDSARLPNVPPPPGAIFPPGTAGCRIVRLMRQHYVAFRFTPASPTLILKSTSWPVTLVLWLALTPAPPGCEDVAISLPGVWTLVQDIRAAVMANVARLNPGDQNRLLG